MRKRDVWILGAAAVLLLALVGFVIGQTYFFPEKAMRVDEAAPEVAALVKAGTFEGAGDGVHHVSGAVRLLRVDDRHYLRFEDYDQTQGPDVFVYLTATAEPSSKEEIESGLLVLIEGGADGGESTKEGNFQQILPVGFDPTTYSGIAIWCDQFNVLFGRASLAAA